MKVVELKVENVKVRILEGHEGLLIATSTSHNGEPAVMLTFYPESRWQMCRLVFQGQRVWNYCGNRPGFVLGILHKNGTHVTIEQSTEQQFETVAAG